MSPIGVILLQILSLLVANIPWGELIRLAMELIKGSAPKVASGSVDPGVARENNIAVMRTATSQSPHMPEWILRIVYEIAYAEYIKDTDPEKFADWEKRAQAWFANVGSKLYTDPEVGTVYDNKFGSMDLYTTHPDKP